MQDPSMEEERFRLSLPKNKFCGDTWMKDLRGFGKNVEMNKSCGVLAFVLSVAVTSECC